jgi:hypothetical protein
MDTRIDAPLKTLDTIFQYATERSEAQPGKKLWRIVSKRPMRLVVDCRVLGGTSSRSD